MQLQAALFQLMLRTRAGTQPRGSLRSYGSRSAYPVVTMAASLHSRKSVASHSAIRSKRVKVLAAYQEEKAPGIGIGGASRSDTKTDESAVKTTKQQKKKKQAENKPASATPAALKYKPKGLVPDGGCASCASAVWLLWVQGGCRDRER